MQPRLCSAVMQNSQIFYGGPVVLIVNNFLEGDFFWRGGAWWERLDQLLEGDFRVFREVLLQGSCLTYSVFHKNATLSFLHYVSNLSKLWMVLTPNFISSLLLSLNDLKSNIELDKSKETNEDKTLSKSIIFRYIHCYLCDQNYKIQFTYHITI